MQNLVKFCSNRFTQVLVDDLKTFHRLLAPPLARLVSQFVESRAAGSQQEFFEAQK